MSDETIVALSSGHLPSGVAVVRISGTSCQLLSQELLGLIPNPRKAELVVISNPKNGEELDHGLSLWFPGPHSFTGEDCLELHLHGGRAVVNAVIGVLCDFKGVRLADAGEFSRRAFENGKLDLTEIEGIADLVSSETEAQRKQALAQSKGDSRETYEAWRKRLIHIPNEISEEGFSQVLSLKNEIEDHLADNHAGEIIRDGFRIALMGKPNAGKSSLLNALAKRDVAIVTNEAGTTRDVLDVHLDIDGYSVIISDTAGLRDSDNIVEVEGIKRAQLSGALADLVIWLSDIEDKDKLPDLDFETILYITTIMNSKLGSGEQGLISRLRYREALEECVSHLSFVLDNKISDIELKADTLRHASDCIGRITGKIDVEDLLDVIFSEFCVGK